MVITINDTVCEVPFYPALIPLGKFIEYHERYGRKLDEELDALMRKKYDKETEEFERQFDFDRQLDKEALAWFSFWTNFDLEAAKEEPFIGPLLNQYRYLREMLTEAQDDAFPATIHWQGEDWQIQEYNIGPASAMDFNEIITSKEVIHQIHKIGKGRWDGLPYLCAVFLRKVGEPFQDKFIQEGSERLRLMYELPLEYAMQVAFFLGVCVTIWSNILASSTSGEALTQSLSY